MASPPCTKPGHPSPQHPSPHSTAPHSPGVKSPLSQDKGAQWRAGEEDAGGGGGLPPGFRFHPTEEELLCYYLKRRVEGRGSRRRDIRDLDLYKYEPWDIPGGPTVSDERFFFTPRDRKYPTGMRANRATPRGYWKATGKDRPVFGERGLAERLVAMGWNKRKRAAGEGGSEPRADEGLASSPGTVGQAVCIGFKKTLVFYMGRAPAGEKTDWVMHEYRLADESDAPDAAGAPLFACQSPTASAFSQGPAGSDLDNPSSAPAGEAAHGPRSPALSWVVVRVYQKRLLSQGADADGAGPGHPHALSARSVGGGLKLKSQLAHSDSSAEGSARNLKRHWAVHIDGEQGLPALRDEGTGLVAPASPSAASETVTGIKAASEDLLPAVKLLLQSGALSNMEGAASRLLQAAQAGPSQRPELPEDLVLSASGGADSWASPASACGESQRVLQPPLMERIHLQRQVPSPGWQCQCQPVMPQPYGDPASGPPNAGIACSSPIATSAAVSMASAVRSSQPLQQQHHQQQQRQCNCATASAPTTPWAGHPSGECAGSGSPTSIVRLLNKPSFAEAANTSPAARQPCPPAAHAQEHRQWQDHHPEQEQQRQLLMQQLQTALATMAAPFRALLEPALTSWVHSSLDSSTPAQQPLLANPMQQQAGSQALEGPVGAPGPAVQQLHAALPGKNGSLVEDNYQDAMQATSWQQAVATTEDQRDPSVPFSLQWLEELLTSSNSQMPSTASALQAKPSGSRITPPNDTLTTEITGPLGTCVPNSSALGSPAAQRVHALEQATSAHQSSSLHPGQAQALGQALGKELDQGQSQPQRQVPQQEQDSGQWQPQMQEPRQGQWVGQGWLQGQAGPACHGVEIVRAATDALLQSLEELQTGPDGQLIVNTAAAANVVAAASASADALLGQLAPSWPPRHAPVPSVQPGSRISLGAGQYGSTVGPGTTGLEAEALLGLRFG